MVLSEIYFDATGILYDVSEASFFFLFLTMHTLSASRCTCCITALVYCNLVRFTFFCNTSEIKKAAIHVM